MSALAATSRSGLDFDDASAQTDEIIEFSISTGTLIFYQNGKFYDQLDRKIDGLLKAELMDRPRDYIERPEERGRALGDYGSVWMDGSMLYIHTATQLLEVKVSQGADLLASRLLEAHKQNPKLTAEDEANGYKMPNADREERVAFLNRRLGL